MAPDMSLGPERDLRLIADCSLKIPEQRPSDSVGTQSIRKQQALKTSTVPCVPFQSVQERYRKVGDISEKRTSNNKKINSLLGTLHILMYESISWTPSVDI